MSRVASRLRGPKGDTGNTGTPGAPGASRYVNVRFCCTVAVADADMIPGVVVDGVTAQTGDIFLQPFKATVPNNGIYVINSSGAATRHTDFDAYSDFDNITVVVSEGTRYKNTNWQCTNNRTGTIGVTDIVFVQKPGAQSTITLTRDGVVERGVVLIPAHYQRDRESASAVLTSPSDGSLFWEVATTVGVGLRVYSDIDERILGNSPIVSATGSNQPLNPGWHRPEIVRWFNDAIQTSHSFLGGTSGNGIILNQFAQGNDPDHAPTMSSGAEVGAVVNTTLNDEGVLRGVTRATGYITYGLPIERTQGGESLFARFTVLADSDSATFAFTEAGAWGYRDGSFTDGSDTFLYAASLEKVRSARLRTYIVAASDIAYDLTRFNMGVRKAGGDTATYIVCNVQFGIQRNGSAGWIMRDDYNKADVGGNRSNLPAPIMSSDLYIVNGRDLDFYPGNVVPLRDQRNFCAALELDVTSDDAAAPYEATGSEHIILDSSKFPLGSSSAYLRMWPGGQPSNPRYEMPVAVHKVAGSGLGKTPKVLVIGDSIGNRRLLKLVDARLLAMGVTVTWVGSIKTSNVDGAASDATGPYGECRESRGLGGMLNCTSNCTASTPLASGDEAAYIAGNKTDKRDRNPLVREAVLPGEAAIAQDGWVFDFDNYVTRLAAMPSVVMPDIVIPLMLTNDWTDDDEATIIENIQFCVPRMLDSILAAKSTMKVGFGMVGWAEGALTESTSTTFISDNEQKRAAMLAEYVAQVNNYKAANPSANASVISAWAHMTPWSGWTLDSAVSVDTATGRRWARQTDGRHPLRSPRAQLAECIAAYIANVA